MSLLPSKSSSETSTQEGDLDVVGLTDEETDDVLDAVSSETAREILRAVHERPSTPSDLSERTGVSIQNLGYHLEKLERANLVSVVDSTYSEKGREMDVYGPADDPVVLFVGTKTRRQRFVDRLKRLFTVGGLVAITSLYVLLRSFGRPASSGTEPFFDLPSILAFFIGGVFVLAVLFLWYSWRLLRSRRGEIIEILKNSLYLKED